MPDTRLWIVARIEGDQLSLRMGASLDYMDEDPVHRTRAATVTLDLLDPAAIRSAAATLVPLVPGVSRERLEGLRQRALPEPNADTLDDLRDTLSEIAASYATSLQRLVRQMSREAELVAYRRDAYDEDGQPVQPDAGDDGLSGGVVVKRG